MCDFTKRPAALGLAAVLAVALDGPASAATDLEALRGGETLRIAVADEAPYGYLAADGEARGAGPDVARPVLAALGIDNIEWLSTSFDDLIPGLREGRFDMAAAEMAIRPERCERVLYSAPNTSYGEGLLVRAANPAEIDGYDDFAKRDDITVGVLAGASQVETFRDLGVNDARVETLTGNAEAIEAITSGRVDAYAGTGLTVSALAEQSEAVEVALNFRDPVIDGEAVRSWGGFAFPPDAEALREAFDTELVDYKSRHAWEDTLTEHGFTQDDILGSFKYSTVQLCSP